MKVMTDVNYNIHLLLDAVKAYIALKDLKLDGTLNCYRCGHFPVYLTYDVRSVCFDDKPDEITNHEYPSSAAMHSNCSQYNLSRSYFDKKNPFIIIALLDENRSFICYTLPPIVSSKNFSSINPYTRPMIKLKKSNCH